MPITACFTGHRPNKLSGYNADHYRTFVSQLSDLLVRLSAEYSITRFISGGAQGFDQLAFWAVNKAKSKGLAVYNDVYVPFKGQDRVWHETGPFSRAEYALMLQRADNVTYLRDNPPASRRDSAIWLNQRNEAMVDSSSLVIALTNGDVTGGTANCMAYAKRKGIPVIRLAFDTDNAGNLRITEVIRPGEPANEVITAFRGKHAFLSNMYPASICMPDGNVYACAEAAFQAYKLTDISERKRLFADKNGYEAKKQGRQVPLPPDWTNERLNVMRLVIHMKFSQHAELQQLLIATGNVPLIEGNSWGDTFWGVSQDGHGVGENWLGKILMEERNRLKIQNERGNV